MGDHFIEVVARVVGGPDIKLRDIASADVPADLLEGNAAVSARYAAADLPVTRITTKRGGGVQSWMIARGNHKGNVPPEWEPEAFAHLSVVRASEMDGYSVRECWSSSGVQTWEVWDESGRTVCSCSDKDDAEAIRSALTAQDDTGDLEPWD